MKLIKEHLFEMAFIFLLAKCLISELNIASSLLLITLVISVVYTKNYLKKQEDTSKSDLENRLNEMNSKINTLALKNGLVKK